MIIPTNQPHKMDLALVVSLVVSLRLIRCVFVVYIASPFVEIVVDVVVFVVFFTVEGFNVGLKVVSMTSFSEIMRFYFLQ